MSSIDLPGQNTDRRDILARGCRGLKSLLADYRRAVAAETFYDHLRCGGDAAAQARIPRSQVARTVFDRFYSVE